MAVYQLKLIFTKKRFLEEFADPNIMAFNIYIEENSSNDIQAGIEAYLQSTLGNRVEIRSKAAELSDIATKIQSFRTVGYSISVLILLIGILNYVNSTLSSIYTRKREFALFSAIGMTNRQLLHMLLYEGVYYFLIVSVISLIPGRALAQWVAFKAIPLQTSTLNSVSDIRLSTLIMLIVITWIVITVTLAVFHKIISESIVNRLNDIKE